MPVPNTFANATATIPLSQLDANFATTITLGNTAIQLGNTVSTLNNMTLANVTVTSGNVTITNVTVTTANVTTANITTAIIGTANVTTANVTTGIIGTANVTTGNITTAVITTANIATSNVTTSQILNYGTANQVQYLDANKSLVGSANLTFNGTTLTVANDASVNGLTVGRGAGNVSTNTAVGASALAANTTGLQNTVLGVSALTTNTSGSGNTGLGWASLNANSTGSFNSAVGRSSLGSNETGSNNTALGYQALVFNTTASNNTAVGYQAGYTNSSGTNVVAVGQGALYTNNANDNTAVGRRAGYLNSSGVGNCFFGTDAGYSTTSGSNSFFGYGAGSNLTSGAKNTIIGRYDGNQDGLDIRTASNYAIISDGDGNRLLSMYNGGTLALDGGATPQAGTGITFPATQSASSNANTLDDYEEGTFTPTLASGFSVAPTSYTNQAGRYTKIGRIVYIEVDIDPNGATANATQIRFGGMPFTVLNASPFGGAYIIYQNSFNTNASDAYIFAENTTQLHVNTNAASPRDGNNAGININNRIIFCGWYTVA